MNGQSREIGNHGYTRHRTKFENTQDVIASVNRQCNGQMKKDEETNHGTQHTTQETKD